MCRISIYIYISHRMCGIYICVYIYVGHIHNRYRMYIEYIQQYYCHYYYYYSYYCESTTTNACMLHMVEHSHVLFHLALHALLCVKPRQGNTITCRVPWQLTLYLCRRYIKYAWELCVQHLEYIIESIEYVESVEYVELP